MGKFYTARDGWGARENQRGVVLWLLLHAPQSTLIHDFSFDILSLTVAQQPADVLSGQ